MIEENRKSDARSFITHAISVGGLSVGSALFGVLNQIVLTHTLGQTNYGEYAVAVSWCLALAAPAMFGIDGAICRFVPRLVAQNLGAPLRQFMRFMLLIQICAILLCVVFSLTFALDRFAKTGLLKVNVAWLLLYMAATSFLGAFSAFFTARREFVAAQAYQNFIRPAVMILFLIALAAFTSKQIDAESAIILTTSSSLIAAAFLSTHIALALRDFGVAGWEREEKWRWLSFSGWIQAGTICNQIVFQAPIIILGSLSSPVEAGHYAIAARMAALVTFGLSAVGTAAISRIAEAYDGGDSHSLAKIARISSRISTAVAILAIVFFLLIRSQFDTLFGRGFSASELPLFILLFGALFNAFTGINAILLSMADQQKATVIALLIGALTLIVLSFELIPSMGAIGAALAALSSTIVGNSIMSVAVWKKLHINVLPVP